MAAARTTEDSLAASWQAIEGGIRVGTPSGVVDLVRDRRGVFRLSVARQDPPAPASAFVVSRPAPPAPDIVTEDSFVGLACEDGAVLIDPANGAWTLRSREGRTLVRPMPLPADAVAFEDGNVVLPVGWLRDTPVLAYGCGNGALTLRHAGATARVGNGLAVVPWMWSPNGFAALAVTASDLRPASWWADTPRSRVVWKFPGDVAHLYLAPAATLKDAARVFGELTGFAPVPPRWTFGYLQSRWGWKDAADLETTFQEFRRRKIPVDAFILDFEWYTQEPDYEVPPAGSPEFPDFSLNPLVFPNPKRQLDEFHRRGLKVVAIRKPRIGDAATLRLVREKGWTLLPPAEPPAPPRGRSVEPSGAVAAEAAPAIDCPGATGAPPAGNASVTEISDPRKWNVRELDFRNAELRRWYAERMAPLLALGFDAWWNDEGESSFLTYHGWNEAERALAERVRPGQRFWSLNRAVTPGLQRLGATAWTGDAYGTWEALAATPTHLLNWGLAGMPYAGCDIGGFRNEVPPELFVRWIQAGVFFPMMRAHTSHEWTPRLPWRFGAEAEPALKQAIELRYRLIPLYYALAHEAHRDGLPVMRPLAMEFPDDGLVADLSNQWLVGDRVLAAPLLQPGNLRSVYLPQERWYPFGGAEEVDGGCVIHVRAALDDIPVFVRAGTILPLGPIVQSTTELPGGPLEVQVYPGDDAAFTLVEDDGATRGYERGRLRELEFRWDDATRTFSWAVRGEYDGADVFRRMCVRLMDEDVATSTELAIGSAGNIAL